MAEADGSVRVDTQLDTESFEKGSDELKRATESVAQAAESAGDRVQAATANMFKGSDTTGLEQNVSAVQEAASSLEQTADQAAEHVREATSGMFQTEGAKTLEQDMADVDLATAKAQLRVEKARQALADFAGQEIPTDEYKTLTREVSRTEAALLRLYDRRDMMEDMGVNQSSAQWRRLELQIGNTEQKLAELESTAEAMRSQGDAFVDPESTLRFQELSLAVREAEENLAALQSRQAAQAEQAGMPEQEQPALDEAESAEEELSAMDELGARISETIHETAEAAREASGAGRAFTEIMRDGLAVVGTALAGFGARIADAVLHPLQALDRLAGSIVVAIKNIGVAALQAAGHAAKLAANLAKTAAQRIGSGLKSIVSHIKNAGKHSRNTALSANALVKAFNGFRRMLVSRIKRTFISYIFSEITTAVKELAKYDARFDQSISNLRNRTTELATNVTSSFGTLIRTVEPYITAILDAASSAVAKISAMLARLRGEDTVIIAKKQTGSYAESLGDSADAASKAEKAQKKLNATLSSYDQLHKLDGSGDADTGAADSSKAGKDLFETVPVERVLGDLPDYGKSIVDRIRASILAGNWFGVGAAVADGLNYIVQAIHRKIDEIRPLAVQWATNIAQGLNGLTSKFDAYALGSTLAAGINTVFAAADAFITTYDWATLGIKIGEGINGLFLNTDWALIGQTLADAFNGVLDVLYFAVTTIEWAEIGAELGAGINKFIADVNWGELGETLGELVKGVLGFIASTIESIDWFSLGENLMTALESIDWEGVTDKLFELVGAVFGGIGAFITGLLSDAITKLSEWWNGTAFDENGEFTLEGLFRGILTAAGNIGQWVKDHIGQPFIDGIEKVFSIDSPSKVMAEEGEYITAGLRNGIEENMNGIPASVGGSAEDVSQRLRAAWSGIKQTAVAQFAALRESIQQAMDDTEKATDEQAERIRANIAGKWEIMRADTARRWDGIRSAVIAKANAIKDALPQKWEAVKTSAAVKFNELRGVVTQKLTDLWDALAHFDFSYIGKNIAAGIEGGLTGAWNGVTNTASGLFTGIVDKAREIFDIHSPSRVFAAIGTYLMTGLRGGMQNGESSVLSTVDDIAQGITDGMAVQLREIAMPDIDAGENRMLAHLDAIADRLRAIAGTFAAIGSAVASMGALPVPQMAAGTVVPPRVRVTGGRPGHAETDDSELIKALYRLIALLERRGGGDSGSIRVPLEIVSKIDRRELARALTEIEITNGRITNGRSRT